MVLGRRLIRSVASRARAVPRALYEVAALGCGRRRLFRVAGRSMAPTFEAGDVVAIRRARPGLPRPGQVVVVHDPTRAGHTLLKRVRSCADESFAVGSDNPAEATDSRSFGSLGRTALIGAARWSWSRRNGFRWVAVRS